MRRHISFLLYANLAIAIFAVAKPVQAVYESAQYVLENPAWRSMPAESDSSQYSLSGSAGFGQGAADAAADSLRAGQSEGAVLPTMPAPVLTTVVRQAGALGLVISLGDNDPNIDVQVTLTNPDGVVTYLSPNGLAASGSEWFAYTAWGGSNGIVAYNLDAVTYEARVRGRADEFSLSEWSNPSNKATPVAVAAGVKQTSVSPLAGLFTDVPTKVSDVVSALHTTLVSTTAVSAAQLLTAAIVPLTAVAALSQLATVGGFALQFAIQLISRLFGSLLSGLQFLAFWKRKDVYGTVVDKTGRHPVEGAVVELLDVENRRQIEVQRTDQHGRYYLMADKHKSYIMRVTHESYDPFEQPVRGRVNIHVDLGKMLEYDQAALESHLRQQAWVKNVNRLRVVMLLIGTIAWAIIFVGDYPSWASYSLGAYYVLAWALELYVRRQPRPYGLVVDRATNKPLDQVVVRVADEDDRLVNTVVCDDDGRFSTWLRSGTYNLRFSKSGYQSTVLRSVHINRSLRSLEVTARLAPA